MAWQVTQSCSAWHEVHDVSERRASAPWWRDVIGPETHTDAGG